MQTINRPAVQSAAALRAIGILSQTKEGRSLMRKEMERKKEAPVKEHIKHYCSRDNPWRKWQIIGVDADNECVWAGPRNAPRRSVKIARKIQRHWRQWRFEYDHLPENINLDYPAKHDKQVVAIIMAPYDGPVGRGVRFEI